MNITRILTAIFTTSMLTACSQGESSNLPANTLINASHNQQTTMDDIYPSLEKSHPKAKALKNKD